VQNDRRAKEGAQPRTVEEVNVQRREFLVVALCSSGSGGCGWLLHPERCGQPHSRDIDWKIAALDGLGLLLFFVPGVVAFVVDFYTGAIYLPPEPWHVPQYPPGQPYGYPPPPTDSASLSGNRPPRGGQAHFAPKAPQNEPVPDGSRTGSQPGYPVLPAPGPQASLGEPAAGTAYVTDLKRVEQPREELSPRRIEEIVSAHVGRPVSLTDDGVRLSHLRQLEQYADHCRRHERDRGFGFSIQRLIDRCHNA
jgi:hypothetical protein